MSRTEKNRARAFKARYRAGDAARVFIYCAEHPQRVPVAEFYYTAPLHPGDGGTWQPDGRNATQQMESMAGDTLVPRSQSRPPDYRLPRRFRYRIRCRLCGHEVQVREDRLDPILGKLRDNGVSELSLSGLSGLL